MCEAFTVLGLFAVLSAFIGELFNVNATDLGASILVYLVSLITAAILEYLLYACIYKMTVKSQILG